MGDVHRSTQTVADKNGRERWMCPCVDSNQKNQPFPGDV